MENTQSDVQKMVELIQDIQFAMLTTVSADDGQLRSRPMTLQKTEFDGHLWFFVGRSTSQVVDIEESPRINLAFSDPKGNSYISVSGQAEIVLDRAKAEELWSPVLKAWFPKGLEDPELALLKVSVESADYWDSPSSKVVQLVGFTKAVLTGQRAGPPETGERKHIELHS